jgi:hypothetical protein
MTVRDIIMQLEGQSGKVLRVRLQNGWEKEGFIDFVSHNGLVGFKTVSGADNGNCLCDEIQSIQVVDGG